MGSMQWRQKQRRHWTESGRRAYLRWFAMITAAIMVPIILLSSYFGMKNADEKRRMINDTNEIYLEQTASAVNLLLSQMQTGYAQLAMKRSFVDFENSYIGGQYEAARAKGEPYDNTGVDRYLEAKQQLFEDINVMRSSNSYIYSIYFYDSRKNLVITDREVNYSFTDFRDKEWYSAALQETSFPVMLNTTGYDEENNNTRKVISLVFRSPNVRENLFVVNVDSYRLFSDVLSRLSKVRYHSLVVLDQERKPLYFTDEADYGYFAEVAASIPEQTHGYFLDGHGSGKNMISYLRNDALPFLFLTATPAGELYSGVQHLQWSFIVVLVVVFLISCLLAVFASNRVYKPYSYIMEKLGHGLPTDGKSNMQMIEQTVSQVLSEKESLLEQMRANNRAYREKFISSLVLGNEMELEEIKAVMRSLDIDLPVSNLYLAVFDLLGGGFGTEQTYYDITANQVVTERIMQLLTGRYKGVMAQVETGKCVLILHLQSEEKDQIHALAKHVVEAVELSLGIRCNAAISPRCATVKSLPQAYADAVALLSYHAFSTVSRVLSSDDVSKGAFPYPAYEMRSLCETIARGDREETMVLFSRLSTRIREACEHGQHTQMKRIFLRMLSELENCAVSMGFHMEDIVGKDVDIYVDMANLQDMDLVFELFLSIIDTLLYGTTPNQGSSNRYIREIVKMLDEDCGPDMTLSAIADRVGIGSTYISRLFKMYMGVTFMDYLTKVRMEKAKQLLADPHVKVKDVARELGYSNADYLIRLFKNYTGMTPSAYKKMIQG